MRPSAQLEFGSASRISRFHFGWSTSARMKYFSLTDPPGHSSTQNTVQAIGAGRDPQRRRRRNPGSGRSDGAGGAEK